MDTGDKIQYGGLLSVFEGMLSVLVTMLVKDKWMLSLVASSKVST